MDRPSNEIELIWQLHREVVEAARDGETSTEQPDVDVPDDIESLGAWIRDVEQSMATITDGQMSRDETIEDIKTRLDAIEERLDELESSSEDADDSEDLQDLQGSEDDLREETEAEKEQVVEDKAGDSDDGVECPYCGKTYKGGRGLGAHISASDDHEPLADLFKEDGEYVCAECGATHPDRSNISSHYSLDHDTTMTEAAIEQMQDDEPYDENGNLPKIGDSKDAMGMDVDQRSVAVKRRLDKAGVALSVKDIVKKYFGNSPDDMSARQAVRRACQQNDNIMMLDSNPQVFYTDAADVSESSVSRAKELIGDRDFDILAHSVSKLLDEDSDEVEISYSDFASVFAGNTNTGTAWKRLCTSSDVQEAIREKLDTDISFSLVNSNDVATSDPERQYVLRLRW